jgi:hypothetical protein
VVVGLGGDTARRFLLSCAVPAGTGRVLVSPADRGVDVGLPGDQSDRIGPRLQQRQQPGPHPLVFHRTPAAKWITVLDDHDRSH